MAATRAEMWVHFVHRHVHDTIVILEEGNLPLPRCPRCDLRVPRRALNGRHRGTAQGSAGAVRKLRRLTAAEGAAGAEGAVEAYGRRLPAVEEFRYLGRVLTATADDWPAVARNLQRAQ